jgi:hypothetical protein
MATWEDVRHHDADVADEQFFVVNKHLTPFVLRFTL